MQKFYAVRVTVTDHGDNGSIHTRDYVRGDKRMGTSAWDAFALGDMLLMVTGDSPDNPVTFSVQEIDARTVADNRQWQHTTEREYI